MQISDNTLGFTPFNHNGCNLAYNPETGECLRQSRLGKWKSVTPGVTSDKYTQVTIAKVHYKLHRLVAQYFLNGGMELARGLVVDHRIPADGTASQDRLSNLRITTVRGNAQNLVNPGKSQFSGVVYSRYAGGKPWTARCKVGGKSIHIGYYSSELEAAAAYIVYLKALGETTEVAEQKYWGAVVCKS